jgi:hypothetical protein
MSSSNWITGLITVCISIEGVVDIALYNCEDRFRTAANIEGG